MTKTISVINGPNLNLLGTREPEIYGNISLEQIVSELRTKAKENGFDLEVFQSNHEGAIVDEIQRVSSLAQGIIINPGAYTHTSVAIRDALVNVKIPIVEVHLSNIFKREDFRKHSFVSEVSTGVVSGFGSTGYILALDYLMRLSGNAHLTKSNCL